MTPDQEALARRLAEHPEFRLACGMRVKALLADGSIATWDAVVVEQGAVTRAWWTDIQHCRQHTRDHYLIPDLTDAATGGVLLAMLAAGEVAVAEYTGSCWQVSHPQSEFLMAEGATLGEAVARALLSVWQ